MRTGSESSADEQGAAAIFATQMDEFLGGGPQQFREVQGYETKTFMGYFKNGVQYKVPAYLKYLALLIPGGKTGSHCSCSHSRM